MRSQAALPGVTRLSALGPIGASIAALLMIATGIIGYRTLAPGDTLSPARTPYPATAAYALDTAYGQLSAAPLIVDDRLRVYAVGRQVWADEPVDALTPTTSFWSLRRWPQQVLGVVAVPAPPTPTGDTSPGPVVVTQWSDGELVAIRVRTGRVAWRAATPARGAYPGGQTGAAVVYQPRYLLSGLYRGRPIVVSTAGGMLLAFDATTGRPLWHRPDPGTGRGCPVTSWTGPDILAAATSCGATSSAVSVIDLGSGAVLARWVLPGGTLAPVGCALGRSQCQAVRTDRDAWLVGPGGSRTRVPALAPAGVWLADGLAITQASDGTLTARDAVSGAVMWRWADTVPAGLATGPNTTGRPVVPGAGTGTRVDPATTRLVAVEAGRVHLITADLRLVTLDLITGVERSRLSLVVQDIAGWRPGVVYARDGFVAVERVPVPGGAADALYASGQVFVLAGS